MKIHLFVLAILTIFALKTPAVRADARGDSIFASGVGLRNSGRDSTSASRLAVRSTRRGLLEPAVFVMAFHTVGMAALVSMDPAETGFKPVHVNNWADGMRNPPVWDNDSWITNYILHPLWGSETYLRARTAKYTPLESFLFSTAASVVWEYGFESWTEHPSKQDLIVTSTVGSLLGEVRFIARRALIRQDEAWATVLLLLVDPLGMFVKHAARLAGHAGAAIASAFTSDVSIAPALAGVDERNPGRAVGFHVTVSL